jgi:ferredoxin
MPFERKISDILGLPNNLANLLDLLLSPGEIRLIMAIDDQDRSGDPSGISEVSVFESQPDLIGTLLRKGLLRDTNNKYRINAGIEGLWALLLDAVQKKEYLPSKEMGLATNYLREYYSNAIKSNPRQYQLFPVEEAFSPKYCSAENLDNLVEVLENAQTIVQKPCRCREVFQNCLRRTNTCLVLNDPMKQNIEQGKATLITLDRAKEILRSNLRNGNIVILHRQDKADLGARMEIHSCCSCCSVLLGAIMDSTVAQLIQTPKLVAKVNASKCNGCATCKEVCMFGARRLVGGVCHVEESLCVGCGLCVPWCTEQAVRMISRSA